MQTLNGNYAFYNALRDYPTLTKKDYKSLCFHFFERLKSSELFRVSQEACVGINTLPWDSQHFGLPMARLEVLAKEGVNTDAISMLVSEAVAEFKRTTGCQHFSIEIEVDNYPVMNACFAAGFQV